ncbi:MAG TPA: DUF1269 domain-containing protein, partial [Thermomicrobiales bacterium]|nr:DUF1269 domain-containing protein [Thermomicrobiales bacterium]
IGALSGSMRDVGVDDDFIKQIRNDVTEGTSALFLLTANAVPEKLAEELKGRNLNFKIIASNLTKEQEDKLMELFSEE